MNNAIHADLLPVLQAKNFAEFFAGIGLVRAGLERQGWSIAFANDISQQKYEMYKGHFENASEHFLIEDIHKIPTERIPFITLATASFPCNDLSLAGSRNGLQGEHSSAFWGLIHLLEQMHDRKPPLVLVENVPGFLTSHKGEDFESALVALNKLGYAVDVFILDAAHFVPQSRQRLFIIGILEELQPATLAFSRDQALFGFGDAVCVPAITWIAAHYLDPAIDEITSKHFPHLVLQEV